MRARIGVALAVLLLWPATARAWDWWDFFDGLSGPGPFKAKFQKAYEVRFWEWDLKDENGKALKGEKKLWAIMKDDTALRWYPVVRVARLDNDSNPQMFADQPNDLRHVSLTVVDLAVMRRVPGTYGAIDVGAGMSVLRFSGTGFDPLYRVGFMGPKFTVSPVAFITGLLVKRGRLERESVWVTVARLPKLYFDMTLMEGFTGRNFGNAETKFSTGWEYKKHYSAYVMVDAQALIGVLFHR